MFKLNQEKYQVFRKDLRESRGKERLKIMVNHPVYAPLRFIRRITVIDAQQSLNALVPMVDEIKKEVNDLKDLSNKLKDVTNKLDKLVRELPPPE